MTKFWPNYGLLGHLEKLTFDLFGCSARPLVARYFHFKSKEIVGNDDKISGFGFKMKDISLGLHFLCFVDIFIDWNIVLVEK